MPDVRFREEEVRRLFVRIVDGDSCGIVGVGTVGKTHLINHFSKNTQVHDYFLSELSGNQLNHHHMMFVNVDPNGLLDPTPVTRECPVTIPASWTGFELIFRRLLTAVRDRQPESEAKSNLLGHLLRLYRSCYDQSGMGPLMTFAFLEEAIDLVFDELLSKNGRLVLVIDEFQKLLTQMPDSFFLNLRALRDLYRYNLLFVISSREEISQMLRRQDPDRLVELEPFLELFRETLYIGGTVLWEDNEDLINFLIKRKLPPGASITMTTKQRLVHLTGGHGGLLRTCFDYIKLIEQIPNEEAILTRLISHAGVRNECMVIMESFSPVEKELMNLLAQSKQKTTALGKVKDRITLALLERKKVVAVQNDQVTITPPVFAQYLIQGFHKKEGYQANE